MKGPKTSTTRLLAGAMVLLTLVGATGCSVSKGVRNELYDSEMDDLLKNTAAYYIVHSETGGAAGLVLKEEMQVLRKQLQEELGGVAIVRQPDEGLLLVFPSDNLFRSGGAQLQAQGQAYVETLCNILKTSQGNRIYLLVHTDNNSSDFMSMQLSEKRARTLRKAFRQQGLRAYTEGKGALVPVITNQSEEGQRQNRRIEVAVVAGRQKIKTIRRALQ